MDKSFGLGIFIWTAGSVIDRHFREQRTLELSPVVVGSVD